MSESAPFPYVVRYESTPYNYGEVQNLLKRMVREFGRPGDHQRWCFKTVTAPVDGQNQWIMDFRFRDPYDATIFGLKYLR